MAASSNAYDLNGQQCETECEYKSLSQVTDEPKTESENTECQLPGAFSLQEPAISPFHPLLDELRSLTQGAPDRASHALEIIRLYSTLWECHVAKASYVQQLEDENELLRASNAHLGHKIEAMDHRLANQEQSLVCYSKAVEKIYTEAGSMLYQWNNPVANPAVGVMRSECGANLSQ